MPPLVLAFLFCTKRYHPTQALMQALMGDASRVGKRRSYYLAGFVFLPFLCPDAGRVAPISACVLQCVSSNLF